MTTQKRLDLAGEMAAAVCAAEDLRKEGKIEEAEKIESRTRELDQLLIQDRQHKKG